MISNYAAALHLSCVCVKCRLSGLQLLSILIFYSMNPFSEGQKVVCISDKFPLVHTTEEDKSDIGKQADLHPQKGVAYEITEILGDYLNFKQFNTIYNIPWYHRTRFAPIENIQEQSKEIVCIHA